jgi:hypothetical protein
MISDVLCDAVEEIERYQREMPEVYNDSPVHEEIEQVKAAMRKLMRKLANPLGFWDIQDPNDPNAPTQPRNVTEELRSGILFTAACRITRDHLEAWGIDVRSCSDEALVETLSALSVNVDFFEDLEELVRKILLEITFSDAADEATVEDAT